MRLFAAFAILAAAPAFAADPVIDKIEAKLFISTDGTLSDNVAEGSGVTLWNTIIGEGGAGPASDTLIVVTVKGEPGSFVEAPLTIDVTGSDGKPVASRKVGGLLITVDGHAVTAVFAPDSTCNELTVKAAIGKSERTTKVPFACGE